jgi:hypothetical protein
MVEAKRLKNALLILLGLGVSAAPQLSPSRGRGSHDAPNGDNQKAEVSQWIGLVKVDAYHSPQVHFRVVSAWVTSGAS